MNDKVRTSIVDVNGKSTHVWKSAQKSVPKSSRIALANIPKKQPSRGYHWADARNQRLSELVRKWKRNEDKSEPSFSICVQNRDGDVILGDPDGGDAESIYMDGGCATFAYATSLATELPIAIFTIDSVQKKGYWRGHFAVKVGEDRYMDIRGISNKREIERYYGTKFEEPDIVDNPYEVARRHGDNSSESEILETLYEQNDERSWLTTFDFIHNGLTENDIPFDMELFDKVENSYPTK